MGEDLMEVHARELLSLPDDWHVFRWEAMPARAPIAVIVTGAVVRDRITKGPRKGGLNWRKRDKSTEVSVPISNALHRDWLLEWERKHGVCHRCQGDGKELSGWNAVTGSRYRSCRRCSGSGVAQSTTEEATNGS